ncbi:Tn7-like element transposition protein TnsE [Clostridium sp.]|uniref:Tn7-like element transposition protein TnsE n=1 Tax=Clostridium sp. TaxID=1506 RepID=UPI0032167322
MIKGLEFKTLDSVVVKGELEEFIEVLKLLEKRADIKKVEIIVGELPDGRKFSRLKDGITGRRYIIGKITMGDGREYSLIEVEREDKSLSILILTGNKLVKWKTIYSILLLGLIEGSGKWSSEDIIKIQRLGIDIVRKKHTPKSILKRENEIYKEI